jgi:hypothetical protein
LGLNSFAGFGMIVATPAFGAATVRAFSVANNLPRIAVQHALLARSPESLFDFRSNTWVNLHHFLYQTARARSGMDRERAATTTTLGDTNGFGALTVEQRDAWNRAVMFYERSIAPRDILFDSALVHVTNQLSDPPNNRTAREARIDSALANALDVAAPVYRSPWWPRHDASRLDRRGAAAADRARRLRRALGSASIREIVAVRAGACRCCDGHKLAGRVHD